MVHAARGVVRAAGPPLGRRQAAERPGSSQAVRRTPPATTPGPLLIGYLRIPTEPECPDAEEPDRGSGERADVPPRKPEWERGAGETLGDGHGVGGLSRQGPPGARGQGQGAVGIQDPVATALDRGAGAEARGNSANLDSPRPEADPARVRGSGAGRRSRSPATLQPTVRIGTSRSTPLVGGRTAVRVSGHWPIPPAPSAWDRCLLRKAPRKGPIPGLGPREPLSDAKDQGPAASTRISLRAEAGGFLHRRRAGRLHPGRHGGLEPPAAGIPAGAAGGQPATPRTTTPRRSG